MAGTDVATRGAVIAPGEAAPEFTLQTPERKDWSLGEALGKGDVVLSFFPFAFTGVCGTEMKCITREMGEWSKKGAQVVGISCDSPFALKAWAEKEGFTHTLLSDLHRKVCKAYGLYWADMNVSQRGTVVIARGAGGRGTVKWSQARQPSNAMKWEEVLATIA